jgi:hypothetical protein
MSETRFDLEQQITECWGIVDDLDYVLQAIESKDEDRMMNIVIGLKDLYNLKFERTFSTFEKMLKEQAKEESQSNYPFNIKEKSVEPFGW